VTSLLRAPTGEKHDAGKEKYSLLPSRGIRAVVRVLMFGADKYGIDNWQLVADHRRRYYDAAVRHMTAWWDGEILDPESGCHHLAHAASCLLFLIAREAG
jgi:hypothetical protein